VVWEESGYDTWTRANSYEEGTAIKAQITIPLDIPDVQVVNVEQNERGECTITIESTSEGTRCRGCGRELKELHGVDEAITLRHLPILGRSVYLRLRPKRYRCPDCEGGPTTTQQLSWYSAKSPHTKAYEKYILLQLVHATIEDVSMKEGLGAQAIEGIVERWISGEVQWAEVKRVKILGLDEIALKKGHRDFVVIVTGKSTSGEVKILAVLPDRKKQTVKQFLERMPRRVMMSRLTAGTEGSDRSSTRRGIRRSATQAVSVSAGARRRSPLSGSPARAATSRTRISSRSRSNRVTLSASKRTSRPTASANVS
jgi:transposase